MDAALPRLTVAQAAARLGVKQQTLYAYVSRGLLERQRNANGSTFDPLDIEAFASGRRAHTAPRPDWQFAQDAQGAQGAPLMVLDTDIALIEDDELYFRGIPARRLATSASFEGVARWLWSGVDSDGVAQRVLDGTGGDGTAGDGRGGDGRGGDGVTSSDTTGPIGGVAGVADPFVADPDAVEAAGAALASLPSAATHLDRIQASVPLLGAADATRHDLDPNAVRAAGARLIAGVVDVLGGGGGSGGGEGEREGGGGGRGKSVRVGTQPPSIAERLWSALSDRHSQPSELAALNAALVLLADHDLAVSTLAVRAAASARATPYAAVSSGLGALDSALHGNASGAASELIGLVLDGTDARTAVAQTVARTGRAAPGFGQPLYVQMDARARVLLPMVAALPGGPPVIAAVDRLAAEVAAHTGRHPNVDLALAALTLATGMPSNAGVAIFAVSRMAGWIAHALDEYTRRPLRLRPRGRYIGPLP
ncbi:citrate synthase [Humibacter sp. RRB41]|uniref:citrate synthase n=1 Tax=Humibacter sp. RRB41 TaxID=2919946 RepID=UPI001FAA5C8C|nr:citrate synthase [Humibacter sp. RRB41]